MSAVCVCVCVGLQSCRDWAAVLSGMVGCGGWAAEAPGSPAAACSSSAQSSEDTQSSDSVTPLSSELRLTARSHPGKDVPPALNIMPQTWQNEPSEDSLSLCRSLHKTACLALCLQPPTATKKNTMLIKLQHFHKQGTSCPKTRRCQSPLWHHKGLSLTPGSTHTFQTRKQKEMDFFFFVLVSPELTRNPVVHVFLRKYWWSDFL